MEETGENCPFDSNLEMEGNNLCCDDEITDRKRKKLEERLLALSAIIPGFNNQMDHTSILDKASKYMNQLQQRVRELEQQQQVESLTNYNNNNNTNKLLLLGSSSSSDEVTSHHDHYYYYGQDHHYHNHKISNSNLPEVKARMMQNQILIIVHCEKQKGIVNKILSQLESLNLSIVNSSVLPFGKSNLNITIVAQMGDGYNMAVDELVKCLRLAILTH